MAEHLRLTSGSIAVGAGLAVAITLTSLAGNLNPFEHIVCTDGSQVYTTGTVQLPGVLLNSPYGGSVHGNVSFPAFGLPGVIESMGTSDFNGGADWAGYGANVTVLTVENHTSNGLGRNSPCTQAFRVEVTPEGGGSGGISIMGPGNTSDIDEPPVLPSGVPGNISFDNGFRLSNSANVSTCGGRAVNLTTISTHLTAWMSWSRAGQNHTLEFDVPFIEEQFIYGFPASLGTWAVDNLSAPGGPGGGWAFDYLGPCG